MVDMSLQRYFTPNIDDYSVKYINNQAWLVPHNPRQPKAEEQGRMIPLPLETIVTLLNDFIDELIIENGESTNINLPDEIELDNKKQQVVGHAIIARELVWEHPIFENHWYEKHDSKYDCISEAFGTAKFINVVWLKFTQKGHVAVVGKGADINFDYTNTCGKLVKTIGEELDPRCVVIIPITKAILGNRETEDIEVAIGNYLLEKGVPIIDYYSHNIRRILPK